MDRSSADELLFLLIDGIKRPAHLFGAAGLHLGKDKGVTIPTDKIDLTSPRSAEIPAQDFPPETLYIARRLILPPCSEGKMRVWIRSRRWAGRPAQNHGDDAGKVHVLEV